MCRLGIRNDVGLGDKTLLWEYIWIGDISLKDRFPILYSLSLQIFLKIEDCGMWDGLLWRRVLFMWEEEMAIQLNEVLNKAHISREQLDKIL